MNSSTPAPSRVAALCLLLLSVLGLILALISAYHLALLESGTAQGPSFCNMSETLNCDRVNQSQYAYFAGVPLASWGIAFYLGLIFASFFAVFHTGLWREKLFKILLPATIGAALYSIYLFFVSYFEIGSLCLMCMGMYVVNFCLLGLIIWQTHAGFFPGAAQGVTTAARELSAAVGLRGAAAMRVTWGWLLLLILCFLIGAITPTVMYATMKRSAARVQPGHETEFLRAWESQTPVTIKISTEGALLGDYMRGPADAAIEVVEFSDLQCPACRQFHFILKDLLARYEGKARLVFKNFPLDSSCNPLIPKPFHLHACQLATFARCAGEQGKFWEVVEGIYSLPSLENEPVADALQNELEALASSLGLDQEGLRACRAEDRPRSKLLADISEGKALEVVGTPSVFVNGRRIKNLSPEALAVVFEHILHR